MGPRSFIYVMDHLPVVLIIGTYNTILKVCMLSVVKPVEGSLQLSADYWIWQTLQYHFYQQRVEK